MANYELFNQPQAGIVDNSRLAFGVPGQQGANNILISEFRKANRMYKYVINEVDNDEHANIQLVNECQKGTVIEVIEIVGACTVSVKAGNNYLVQNLENTDYTLIVLNYYHSDNATVNIVIECSDGSGKVAIGYIKKLIEL